MAITITGAITHNKVAVGADDPTKEINKGEWNDTHAASLSLSGFGTGVQTALGTNVGSAGAFVVNGGALGTPSSGVLTNCTGQFYTLFTANAAGNPADNQTTYTGLQGAMSTTAAINTMRFPTAGVVTDIYIEIAVAGILGTTEQATISFRLNNTTDTQITAVAQYDAARQVYTLTGQSIVVAAGDYYQIKAVQPTWSTNPTQVVVSSVVLVRTT